MDNSNTTYTVGVNVTPSTLVGFGANYGRDRYAANQRSRNANPPPDLQFNDPTARLDAEQRGARQQLQSLPRSAEGDPQDGRPLQL